MYAFDNAQELTGRTSEKVTMLSLLLLSFALSSARVFQEEKATGISVRETDSSSLFLEQMFLKVSQR
jgi:hypothetical protein